MPAKQSDFTATEIKAGVLVLVSLVVLTAFVAAMRGCGTGKADINTFTADFTSINGLNLGADVRFGGVKAGKVVAIGADPEDRSRIRVTFDVDSEVPVNQGSVATIDQVSLTTSMHLEISTGGKDEPLHTTGDRVRSVTTSGDFVDIPDIEGVITRLETMLDGIIVLLGVERAQLAAEQSGEELVDMAAVAASLSKTLEAGTATVENVGATVSENREGFREIVERLTELEVVATELVSNLNAAVEENRQPLQATMANFETLSEDAASQLQELTESLAVTLKHLEEVSGNTSDLMESRRSTLEQILLNLESATRSLKQFTQTLSEQPNALVRGAKPQGRSNGGTE